MQNFEDLRVRQEARSLYNEIWKIFGHEGFRDYFFKDQILRATLSIGNNIAEGFERETNKELIRFLYIAKGSAGELRSMIRYAINCQYLEEDHAKQLADHATKISIMLYKYINSVTKN